MSVPANNQFPTYADLERIAKLKRYDLITDGEKGQLSVFGLHEHIRKQYKDSKMIVYLETDIPNNISEFYGDLVQGNAEDVQFTIADENAQDTVTDIVYENDLQERISDYAYDQSKFGFVVFLGRVEDGKFYVDVVGQDQYFPQADGSVIFVTYKKDPADKNGKKLLMYTQHYQLKGEDVQIERQAFTTDDKGRASEPYSLELMGEIMGRKLEPLETIKGLGDLPIRQVDNGRRGKSGFGRSDYEGIMNNLGEVNERRTHIATQLLKNLTAKQTLPSALIDEETGKTKDFEAVGVNSKDDPIPQFIVNTNPLISEARDHIRDELRIISTTTGVPMFQLIKDGSQPDRVEALKLAYFSAIRKAIKKRSKIVRALQDMFRIGFKMLEMGEVKDDVTIKFGDIFPTDELVQSETENTRVSAGLSSKKSAMKRLYGYTDEEADAELKEIENENRISGVVNPTNNAITL